MTTYHAEAAVPLQAQYRRGDRLLSMALLVYALGAVAVAMFRASPGLSVGFALALSLLLAAPGLLAALVWPGALASRLLMAFSLSALVMLHIQAGAGLI